MNTLYLLLWETISNLRKILINLFIYNYIKNFYKNYILFLILLYDFTNYL